MNYLALGDSYTVGEAVLTNDSFPFQLVTLYQKTKNPINSIKVIAQTGWTSDELIVGINKAEFNSLYDLITLCIGVNNQYRNYKLSQFTTDFHSILNICNELKTENGKIAVLSIPDYGITQFGKKNGDSIHISQELCEYNSIIDSICKDRGLIYVNIFDHSKQAEKDNLLIAKDGLHPSKLMYRFWAKMLFKSLK
jgi:lysophospholipase L1-like esterase